MHLTTDATGAQPIDDRRPGDAKSVEINQRDRQMPGRHPLRREAGRPNMRAERAQAGVVMGVLGAPLGDETRQFA